MPVRLAPAGELREGRGGVTGGLTRRRDILAVTARRGICRYDPAMIGTRLALGVGLLALDFGLAGAARAQVPTPAAEHLVALSSTTVFSVDTQTGALWAAGTPSKFLQGAMAKDQAGRLYVTTGDVTSEIWQLDPLQGQLQQVCASGVPGVRALADGPSSTLYALRHVSLPASLADTSNLYRIDLLAGGATLLGNSGLKKIQGLEAGPGGELYGWSLDHGLVSIDPATGAASDPFPQSGTSNLNLQTLAFDAAGVLWGLGHDLYTIDVATGVATLVADVPSIGGDTLFGMAFTTETVGGTFWLAPPKSAAAGTFMTLQIFGAPPGASMLLVFGLHPGTLPLGSCPGASLAMLDPQLAAVLAGGANGETLYQNLVRPSYAGLVVVAQAFVPSACLVTNAVTISF